MLARIDEPVGQPARAATTADVLRGARKLHRFFEHRCDLDPAAPALDCGDATLTYGELDRRANRLARLLRRQGIGGGDRVGILLERSVDMYVALLAVMKAGAAYVPLDPVFPAERIAFIAADAGLALLVTSGALAAGLSVPPPCPTLEVDRSRAAIAACAPSRPAAPDGAPDDLCYIIYTSGTTGRPKGVAVAHASVTDFLRAAFDVYGVRAGDRVYQGITIAFDFAVEEIWLTFIAGAVLVPGRGEGCRVGDGLARFLVRNRITVLGCVPTVLATVDRELPDVRLLIVGGEHCPPELVARWARPGRRMLNTYGPTESVVTATWTEVVPGRPVTIGRPFPGYRAYILDADLRPVPPGEVGEIHVGGIGVALGYVNRPELTRERFVADPFARPGEPGEPGARMYKTGDLGRFTAEGDIECLGRIDTQVKIRGFRLETAEVEAVLLEDPEVENAVVSVWEPSPGGKELVAYVRPRRPDRELPVDALRRRLRERLPAYMVPAFFEAVAEIPMLANGKADRLALPPPASARLASDRPHVDAEGALERAVAGVWAELLGRGRVSVEDDFFQDLGGHSLLAARVVSALRRRPETADVGVGELYADPTVRRLAARIGARARDATPDEGVAAAEPSAATASSGRVALCGAGQAAALYALVGTLGLPFAGLVAAWPAVAGLPPDTLLPVTAALMLGLPFAMLAFGAAVALAVKWLVIGRYRAGSYPLWGRYYLRWWLAQKAQALAAPLGLLAGSPLMAAYARLLGARVGPGCHLGTPNLLVPDMLEIGAGTSIGHGTHLAGYRIEGGMLHIGPVRVGRSCYVGSASVLLPGAVMEDGARLGDQSLLAGGQTVPAGEGWAGSPARREAQADPTLDALAAREAAAPGRAARLGLAAAHLAMVVPLSLPVWAGALPAFALVHATYRAHGGLWYVPAAFPAAAVFVVLFCLASAGLKRVLLPTVEPGVRPIHGGFYLRKWSVDLLMGMSLRVTDALYSTLYAAPFLRLMGASIGRNAEVSTVAHVTPNLLRIDDESFVADAAYVGPARVFNGSVMLAPTRIGRRSFVGNVALLPGGDELAEGCLLGVLSVPPAEGVRPGTDWLGSPAMFLPRRQASESFPEELTFRPSRRLYAERLAVEFLRIVLPPTLWLASAALVIDATLRIAALGPFALVGAALPLVWLASALAATLLVAAFKRVLIGTYRPLVRPLWGRFVRRTELMTGLYENVPAPMLLGLLTGTPMIAPLMRLFGVGIGRRVCMETTHVTEFDLVSIGDDSQVGMQASLQTHLFEDRVMKMSHVRVGEGCTVGARGVVLYDSAMEDGSTLDALSLLMKGEVLPAGTRWRGIPAQRVGGALPPALAGVAASADRAGGGAPSPDEPVGRGASDRPTASPA